MYPTLLWVLSRSKTLGGGSSLEDTSLKTTRRQADAAVIVEVDGDLDVYNAAMLRGAIGKAFAGSGDAPLVLDLRHVIYIDSAGLAALLWTKSARRESRFGIQILIASGGQPERLFKLAVFESIVTVSSALSYNHAQQKRLTPIGDRLFGLASYSASTNFDQSGSMNTNCVR